MQLPSDFIQKTKPLLGEGWVSFVAALECDSPTSIRLNKTKTSELHIPLNNVVPWCNGAYYLAERPQFTFDPLFHAGCYYVQEASSMFIAQAFTQYVKGDVKVLDLCAAPGGKSTLIADLLSDNSLLVSNEVIRSRANVLSENITKWGRPNSVVTNTDPERIGKLEEFFDVILVDAPCSGEGMFRKDKGAISEWSIDNVKLCKERQQRIVADVWDALKPGGLLIYSTCTYNASENEENVQWIIDQMGAKSLPIEIKEEWNIDKSNADGIECYHFLPGRIQGEGFFCALLQKDERESYQSNLNKRKAKESKKKIELDIQYKKYLQDYSNFEFYPQGDFWFAFPSMLFADLQIVKEKLNIVSAGICVGEVKGRDFIPNQSLALSNCLNREGFEQCDIDWVKAISYLRKEVLVFEDSPKGYILLTYRSIPLGFVKNIGNRANNIYPQEWRIRSNNLPETAVSVL